ncbi:MAG: hypothetical protein BEN18_01500 [Epulopiscium sp. Nuni2H_MBin001]|nr:MAG: hypothetical protein BEN18_01500 [Epulopiscium sp. Nuni2H_MBin001]
MKKLLLLTLISLTLCSCSNSQGATGESYEITDIARIEQYNQIAIDAVNKYFDITIDENLEFTKKALESYMPANDDTDELTYFANIFQASRALDDLVDGDISAYGVVLDANGVEINGLLVSILNDNLPIIEFTNEQLIQISETFLRKYDLIEDGDIITHIPAEKEFSSSSQITMQQFETTTHKFVIGISTQYNKVIYFEKVEK